MHGIDLDINIGVSVLRNGQNYHQSSLRYFYPGLYTYHLIIIIYLFYKTACKYKFEYRVTNNTFPINYK